MAAMKRAIIAALEQLKSADFKRFIWELENRVTDGIDKIPPSKLEKADHMDVADLMGQYFTTNAGNIAVTALRNISKHDLADELEQKLPKGHSYHLAQQPEQVAGGNAQVSVEETLLIQDDWTRPHSIIECSQESKDRILRENEKKIYIPKDKSQRKRLALLVTNIRFDHLSYRNGAEEDEKNMDWLLTALGYSVEKHRNLTGEEIKTEVEKFAARSEHQDSDGTFVVLMSHGDRIENKDAILGVKYHHEKNPNDFFFVDDIFSHLNSEKCHALIDKPKVILIQACRGDHPGGVAIQSDAANQVVHVEKDFISFKSCLPGISAYRDLVNGSFFIMYIVEVFCRSAHTDSITELFRKVTACMAEDPRFKQIQKILPCIDRTSLHYKLYLFPGL